MPIISGSVNTQDTDCHATESDPSLVEVLFPLLPRYRSTCSECKPQHAAASLGKKSPQVNADDPE